MIRHLDIQLALQQRLLTLQVCTTGSTTLSATATGYARAAGSFITDGFAPGMELVGSGFNATNNAAKTITGVTALTLTCPGTLVESAAAGRTLSVGLPVGRRWENLTFEPTDRQPYVEEQFVGGPVSQVTVGPTGDLELTPLYVIDVHVTQDSGPAAASRYADALLQHFPPRLELPVGAEVLRVNWNPAPFRGQLLRLDNGYSFLSVTIPLWARSPNLI